MNPLRHVRDWLDPDGYFHGLLNIAAGIICLISLPGWLIGWLLGGGSEYYKLADVSGAFALVLICLVGLWSRGQY